MEKRDQGPPPYYPDLQQETKQPGVVSYSVPATVVVQPAGVMISPDPVNMTCPHCGAQITTNVEFENGTCTWLAAGGLCLFGCWLGCCLIPTCVDGCKDAKHTCPACKQFIGKYRRL